MPDDDFAILFQRVGHKLQMVSSAISAQRVFASTVSGFDLQIIHIFRWRGIAKNFVVAAANITAEEPAKFLPVLVKIQNHLRRTENVSGIAKRHSHAIHDKNGRS